MRGNWTIKRWMAVVAGSAVACAAGVSAAPLQPSGKWEVQYSDVACTAKRSFGDYTLEFQPSPFGKTARLVVEGAGRVSRDRQYDVVIEPADGGPIKVSSLLYPAEKARRGLFIILPMQDAQRAIQGPMLRIHISSNGPKTAQGFSPNPQSQMSAEFALGSTVALSRSMTTCIDDLRKHWGIVDGKPLIGVSSAKPKPGRRAIFTSDDYPADAYKHDQNGRTRYLLMIDEMGNLLDCVVDESSGVASLDAMGCQGLLKRAKFEPPLDAAGKPTKAIQQFTLTWQLEG